MEKYEFDFWFWMRKPSGISTIYLCEHFALKPAKNNPRRWQGIQQNMI